MFSGCETENLDAFNDFSTDDFGWLDDGLPRFEYGIRLAVVDHPFR